MNTEPVPSVGDTQDATQAEGAERATSEVSRDDESAADDASRSPEEESQSQLPGDPRPPHALQPPTKEQY